MKWRITENSGFFRVEILIYDRDLFCSRKRWIPIDEKRFRTLDEAEKEAQLKVGEWKPVSGDSPSAIPARNETGGVAT